MEEKIIYNSQEKICRNIPLEEKGVSTLLIPEDLMKRLRYKLKSYGGNAQYLTYLISRYKIILRTFTMDPSGLKTEYQYKNQNLKKVNFRPLAADWAELGTFSIASGKSRCLIFVLLLLMDLNGWGKLMKRAGVVMNDPFFVEQRWELLGSFGVERQSEQCVRSFTPRLIPEVFDRTD
ncbi:MAG TPA: DUF1564 family protein [Leptospiraceae bacterium]|nr:DUF1564 family protein [Leptospiraceae bacterium]HNF22967.1 DUF1564 family protein [Leptospiraceae bacterium]HNI96740.1 DUF1564 family protein [Leptospiraceae bacterium]HNN02705.1 DUF1564 family protein [Leptospiraceae bacterium]